MASSAFRAIVRGEVQGVAFRAATQTRAGELGVLGWVKNLPTGEVEVHAEGDTQSVAELGAFLHEGPPAAEVEAVDLRAVKPEGHEQFAIRGISAGRFLVAGAARGYELWFELPGDGWRGWTLTKAPSMQPVDKRFAVPIDRPGGPPTEAEAGEPWDQGSYEQGGRVPWPEAIDRGHAVFVLHGERLQGGFALQRTPRGWLLIKRRDEHAAS